MFLRFRFSVTSGPHPPRRARPRYASLSQARDAARVIAAATRQPATIWRHGGGEPSREHVVDPLGAPPRPANDNAVPPFPPAAAQR